MSTSDKRYEKHGSAVRYSRTKGPRAGVWETRTPKKKSGPKPKIRDPFKEVGDTLRPIYEEKYRHIYEPPVQVIRDKEGLLPPPDNFEDIDLRELYSPQSKYTPEEKIFAVTIWVVTGDIDTVHMLTTIPKHTIQHWRQSALWWPDAVNEVKKRKQEELDGRWTQIIHATTEQILERVEGGNPRFNVRTGKIDWVPLDSKELLFTLGVAFEKRALVRGDPTSRHERVSTDSRLEVLQTKMLEAYSKLREEASKIKPNTEGVDIDHAETNAQGSEEGSLKEGSKGESKEPLRLRDDGQGKKEIPQEILDRLYQNN